MENVFQKQDRVWSQFDIELCMKDSGSIIYILKTGIAFIVSLSKAHPAGYRVL